VKTNIGHAGGAAGIAGLLKTILALGKRNDSAESQLCRPKPAIDLDGLGLRVNTTLTPWPVGDEPRRAGVSSFGMGGRMPTCSSSRPRRSGTVSRLNVMTRRWPGWCRVVRSRR